MSLAELFQSRQDIAAHALALEKAIDEYEHGKIHEPLDLQLERSGLSHELADNDIYPDDPHAASAPYIQYQLFIDDLTAQFDYEAAYEAKFGLQADTYFRTISTHSYQSKGIPAKLRPAGVPCADFYLVQVILTSTGETIPVQMPPGYGGTFGGCGIQLTFPSIIVVIFKIPWFDG